ncbi:MAG: hypothetical protein R3B90_16070 [Planctomycetaceae bacterium]
MSAATGTLPQVLQRGRAFPAGLRPGRSPGLKLAALLHDAHEAYWGLADPQKPIKALMPECVVNWLEDHRARIDAAVADRFDFDVQLLKDPRIKLADRLAVAIEQRDLMLPPPAPWDDMLAPVDGFKVYGHPPDDAAGMFIERLYRLSRVRSTAAAKPARAKRW